MIVGVQVEVTADDDRQSRRSAGDGSGDINHQVVEVQCGLEVEADDRDEGGKLDSDVVVG